MHGVMRSVIALGVFDGMHAGHRMLLDETVKIAKQNHWQSVVYTFSNHPRSIFGVAPDLLSTNEEKRRDMQKIGIDQVCMEFFDEKMSRMLPREFIIYLCEKFNIGAVVTGFNYTFGYRGEGNTDLLKELGKEFDFQVSVVPEVTIDGVSASSSNIREAIQMGDVKLAGKLLRRPYTLTGKIVKNRNIGTKIGFPTANLDIPPNKLLPAFGVYATYAYVDGEWYSAVTNVGTNPTVSDEKIVSVETNLLHFSSMIYDEVLTVAFCERLRGQKQFASTQELAQQISKDVQQAQKICENYKDEIEKIFT